VPTKLNCLATRRKWPAGQANGYVVTVATISDAIFASLQSVSDSFGGIARSAYNQIRQR